MNKSSLSIVEKEKKLKFIKDHIGEFPDFPQKGVLFRYYFFEEKKCLLLITNYNFLHSGIYLPLYWMEKYVKQFVIYLSIMFNHL